MENYFGWFDETPESLCYVFAKQKGENWPNFGAKWTHFERWFTQLPIKCTKNQKQHVCHSASESSQSTISFHCLRKISNILSNLNQKKKIPSQRPKKLANDTHGAVYQELRNLSLYCELYSSYDSSLIPLCQYSCYFPDKWEWSMNAAAFSKYDNYTLKVYHHDL